MSKSKDIQVAVIMGSKSDWETMRPASEILAEFGIVHECRVLSAHRTPKELTEYIEEAEARGCKVFIGGAKMGIQHHSSSLQGCIIVVDHRISIILHR